MSKSGIYLILGIVSLGISIVLNHRSSGNEDLIYFATILACFILGLVFLLNWFLEYFK